MNFQEDELKEVWELFEQDVLRALDEAEAALLEIRSGGADGSAAIDQLYRGLHSIKGNARAMGWEGAESFTHAAEDLVALCRDGVASLEGEIFETILEVVDRIRSRLPRAVAKRQDLDIEADGDLLALHDRLVEWVKISDRSGDRAAATDEDFLLFDDLDEDEEPLESSTADEDATEQQQRSSGVKTPASPADVGDAASDASARAGVASPAAPQEENEASEESVFVQVRASRVRELLALASDLGLAADVVITDERVRSAATDSGPLTENLHRLRRLTRDLRFASSALALVPVAELFNRLRRVARDLARQTNKAFDVVVNGESTEIDRFLIDHLYDPMLHIVRNAVDHGLEDSQVRERSNKPARGRIELSASNSGQGILLEVRDDGRGLDRDAIIAKARKVGLLAEDDEVSDDQLGDLVLRPGFSTKQAVSNLSGRGVGLDVVNRAIQDMRGNLTILSNPGEGTLFRLQLPLTLTFADVLLVQVTERSYAIPLGHVRRILNPSRDQYIKSPNSAGEYLRVGSSSVPLLRLHESRTGAPDTIVAIHTSRGDFALPVANVLGTAQVTLRPLSQLLSGIRGASACGLLANGEIAIAIDCERLASHASC